MNTALQKHTQLTALVKAPHISGRFTEVLGKRAPQFISSLLQVGNSLGPDCDAMTIISGSMVAASLDLPINKNLGFAWLVPFKEQGVKKAQFQMGYKGYIQLALRTRQYRRMNAGPVNAECIGGWDAVGEREIDFSKYDPDKPTAGYFFAFEMVNGFVKRSLWTKKEVEAHAKQYSQSYRGGYISPWKTHFDEMATKTVIANELRQWGILSVEMQEAITKDQAVVSSLDGDATFVDAVPIESTVVESPVVSTDAAEPQDQDGDLGPQRPEAKAEKGFKPGPLHREAKPKSAPKQGASLPTQLSARDQLRTLMEQNKISYDQFSRWADGIGVVANCTSYPSFDDIPEEDAQRVLVANKNGSVVSDILESVGAPNE